MVKFLTPASRSERHLRVKYVTSNFFVNFMLNIWASQPFFKPSVRIVVTGYKCRKARIKGLKQVKANQISQTRCKQDRTLTLATRATRLQKFRVETGEHQFLQVTQNEG